MKEYFGINRSIACLLMDWRHGPLARYLKLVLRKRRECREYFPRHRGLAILTCITARAWRMLGSLISGFLWSRWRGKRSRHSRRMRNPQFYVSGKRPMNPEHQQPWYSQRKTAMFLAFFIINSNSKNLINFREWHLYFYRKWFDTRRV